VPREKSRGIRVCIGCRESAMNEEDIKRLLSRVSIYMNQGWKKHSVGNLQVIMFKRDRYMTIKIDPNTKIMSTVYETK